MKLHKFEAGSETGCTWGEEGREIVEDLGVPLASCEAHHRAHLQREGAQLLPRAQPVHLQHIFHVVEETHKQEAGVRTGCKHCRGREGRFRSASQLLLKRRRWRRRDLTNDVLVMLRDELLPVAWIRRSKVDVDEAITRRVQVGLEREHRVLVGDVFVLGVKVVDELHPRQKS